MGQAVVVPIPEDSGETWKQRDSKWDLLVLVGFMEINRPTQQLLDAQRRGSLEGIS